MAKDVKIAGATYTAVPSVLLPTPEGGAAKFVDESEIVRYYVVATEPASAAGYGEGDIILVTGG